MRRAYVVGVALVLAGCAGPDADGATAVVAQYAGALAAHDGATVCRLLAPATAEEVVKSEGRRCDRGIFDEDLPSPGRLDEAQVWGQQALVRGSADTLFLARFPSGWRVVAAGCSTRQDRPYDCQIGGG